MIYVTSFNKHLFEATGKSMMDSFAKYQPNDQLVVFYEDGIQLPEYQCAISPISIDENEFLLNWLETNRDIIPEIFGGTFKCKCLTDNHMQGHKDGCAAGGMRRRTAHWFRKVTSWKIASEVLIDAFVWIDSDTVFNRHIPEELIRKQLSHCCVRFHYGKARRQRGSGIETGVVLFDLKNGGKEVIQNICTKFTDGSFREQKRWDDAWMLTVVAEEMGLIKQGDVCPLAMVSDPIRMGPFARFLVHKKGIHWKKHNVNSQGIK